ncbi:hypothetical protein SAMN02745157_0696 [Kaistia soli DSM 19436]|uniref:Phage head-tail joining protein n=1 Tax=Kaistia soli DSM 19436 TaxID=1122133 RepID=A0A1M4VFZ9_9HYPH|nr:hypothetical protein [Kaistia soli]SHE67946.1 hypothetical protein SAMN02745157_0696 [Kaistia soli DSM 19436]
MAVESDADRAVFVNPDEFGRVALYAKAGAAEAVAVPVLHDLPSTQLFDGPGLASDEPSLTVRIFDLPVGYGVDDVVTVDGATYAVRKIDRDGRGMARLQLEDIGE